VLSVTSERSAAQAATTPGATTLAETTPAAMTLAGTTPAETTPSETTPPETTPAITTAATESGAAIGPAATALLGVYRPAAPLFVRGEGSRLFDEEGRGYIDFTSGLGVNALGYGDAGLRAAIGAALSGGVLHTSNLFRTANAARLAEQLVGHSFADRVFFCNSGGEAMEGALKFARRWAREEGGAEKHEVVAMRGSFHGRLFGTLAVTDRPAFREPFEPVMPGARFVKIEDEAGLTTTISQTRTAAIVVEPVQGEGGIRPVPASWLERLREAATAANALLIFDEVQCGLGRTGRLFAYENTGVVPDVVALAKPLAGGLPMGAVLMTARVAAAIRPGDHATTFGGGPLVSAAALHVLERMAEPAFLERVRIMGAHIRERVGGWVGERGVVELRGVGLMWGLESTGAAAEITARALAAGLLLAPAGERTVRLLPPLTITDEELDDGLDILWSVLQ